MRQLIGYLSAKKQHAKTGADRAIYAELLDDCRQFPNRYLQITALAKLIGA